MQHLRNILFALLLAAGLGTIANLLIDNPYTHQAVAVAVNSKAKKYTYVEVKFQAIKVTLLPLGLDLFGLELIHSENPDLAIAKSSHVRAKLSLWALLLGRFKLSIVESRDLEFTWPLPSMPEHNANGHLYGGFYGLLKDPPTLSADESFFEWPIPMSIPVDRIVLQSAKIAIDHNFSENGQDPDSLVSASFSGLDLDLKPGEFRNITTKLHIGVANLAIGPHSLVEDGELKIESSITQNAVHSTSYSLRSERTNLTGSLTGLIQSTGQKPALLESVDLEVQVGGTADLSLLGSALDIGDTRGPVTGNLAGRVFIPVESKRPLAIEIKGPVEVKDGYIYGYRLHNSKGDLRITEDRLAFDRVEAVIGSTTVGEAKGEILFNDPLDFLFQIRPYSLRLSEILSVFTVDFTGVDFKMRSPLVTLKGTGFPFQLTVGGALELYEFNVAVLNTTQPLAKSLPTCLVKAELSATSKSFLIEQIQGNCAPFTALAERTKESLPFEMSKIRTESDASDLKVSGPIGFSEAKGLTLKVEAKALHASLLNGMQPVPLEGIGSTNIVVHGPYSSVQADITLAMANFRANGMSFGSVNGQAIAYDDRIEWKNVTAALPGKGNAWSKKGKLDYQPWFPIDADLNAENVAPALVQEHIRTIFPNSTVSFGLPRFEGHIKGKFLEPLTYQGDFQASLSALTHDGQILADSLVLKGFGDLKESGISSAALRLGPLPASGSLKIIKAKGPKAIAAPLPEGLWRSLGGDPRDQVEVNFQMGSAAKQKDLAAFTVLNDQLRHLPYVGSSLENAGIGGQLNLTGSLKGPATQLAGTIEGGLTPLNVLGTDLAPIRYRAFAVGQKVDIVANHSGSSLEARISLRVLDDGLPFEWYLRANRLDLRAFGTPVFTKDPRNYAYINGDWDLKGRLLDFWNAEGKLNLTDLRIQYMREVGGEIKSVVLKNNRPALLQIQNGFWQLSDAAPWTIGGDSLQLNLSLAGNQPPNDLNIKFDSLIDMGLIREFVEQVESGSGKIKASGAILGSIENPKIQVLLTNAVPTPEKPGWEPLSIGFADSRPAFKNIKGKITYENGRFIVDQLEADKGNGRVIVNGSLRGFTETNEESNLEVTLRDAAFAFPLSIFLFDSTVTGDLVLSGSEKPYKLSGQVQINRARSSRDFDIRQEILNAALRGRSSTSGGGSFAAPLMEFDVAVNARSSINISNRNIQGTLSTDLQITGTDVSPSVGGQLEVVRGKFFYRRDFTIKKGIFVFDDPLKIDPFIDVFAASEVGNYRVYITASGRASDPRIDLSVDPPIREDGTPISKVDILLLLSSGSFPQTNRNGQGGFSTEDASKSAGTEALNLFVGQFEEPVEKLFDLSGQRIVRQVYIDTYFSEASDKPVPRFNVPLNLSRDLDVMLRYDAEGTWRVSSELPLHDSISLFGSVEQQKNESRNQSRAPADTGLDLRFRFSFP